VQPNALQHAPLDALLERLDVNANVGQLGHHLQGTGDD
jgi:hypothetical protein